MNLVFIAIVVSLSALVIVQAVRNSRFDELSDERSKSLPGVLLAGVVLLVADIILGGEMVVRFAADMSVLLLSVLLLNFSIPLKENMASFMRKSLKTIELLLSVYYVTCALHILPLWDDLVFMGIAVGLVVLVGVLYLWLLCNRMYEIKALLKSGTVWSYVNVCVDAVYVIVPLILLALVVFLFHLSGSVRISMSVAIIFIALEVIASSLRLVFGSAFVLLQKHERVIVESMKISNGEVSAANSKADGMYNDVYERIVLYFEMHKPYLDSELTINDVVKVVYSNKVYISRAICHFTGRNFRQFVNYHRVMYSMDIFRRDPSLKVAELASQSGFNSVVSYTSSFRLFMNETPSEWCRKEKTRLIKTKN